jgi:CelD/BcsL family acetyltransferase involved in cellulose biosynthesis
VARRLRYRCARDLCYWSRPVGDQDRIELRTRVVRDIREITRLVPSWWSLLERAASPQPTQTPLWLLTWWDVFGRSGGRSLRIVVMEDPAGSIVAIVPLLRRWVMDGALFPVLTLELIGSGERQEDEIFSEYIGAVVARGSERAAAQTLAAMLRRGDLGAWDELTMPAMSSEDPWVPLLAEALTAEGIDAGVTTSLECPFIALPKTWDAYVAGLDGNGRYFVRRTLREFDAWAKPGGAKLCAATTEDELDRGFQLLEALHGDRWSGSGGGAFQSERFRRFHRAVTRGLLRGEGGALDLLWLEVRGEPVAALYSIVYRGHVHFYQSGRKTDVPKNVRPGIAIHLLAIQRAIAAGHHTYDFLAHPNQYKQKLAPTHRRHLAALSASGPSLRARASKKARAEARMLVKRLREARGQLERLRGGQIQAAPAPLTKPNDTEQ